MTISTRGRYALRVMIALAEAEPGTYLPLKTIAARDALSEKYLESIIAALVRADMITGARGKGGGYRLTRPPEQYSVGCILRLAEGSLAPVSCLSGGAEPCAHAGECRTLPVWQELERRINEYLDSVMLTDLLPADRAACAGRRKNSSGS